MDWKYGYLRVSKDGRKRIDLYNSVSDRSTTSYARYILSVSLGRYLSSDEEADHINNNCSDDSFDNLQILSIEEHKEKTRLFCEGRTYSSCICSFCGITYTRETRALRGKRTFCSRSCNSKYSRKFLGWGTKPTKSTLDIDKITSLRKDGNSDYKIADLTGIERSKVWRIRRENGIP